MIASNRHLMLECVWGELIDSEALRKCGRCAYSYICAYLRIHHDMYLCTCSNSKRQVAKWIAMHDTNAQGRAAHAAGRMVQQGIRVADAAHRRGVQLYMENPAGSL